MMSAIVWMAVGANIGFAVMNFVAGTRFNYWAGAFNLAVAALLLSLLVR